MKKIINNFRFRIKDLGFKILNPKSQILICIALFAIGIRGYAQEIPAPVAAPAPAPATTPAPPPADKPADIERVDNTFRGNFIIDNQTVDVAQKKTLEFDIQHRFGTINTGFQDMYGVFAPAIIRLGLSYTPMDNLQLGIGICKERLQFDGNLKYSFTKQAVKGGCPVSVTYYGNAAVSELPKAGNFVSDYDRFSYFNQLIIARKVTEKFSVQVSPSLSYFNNVAAYKSSDGSLQPLMKNAHYAIAASGSYMLTDLFGFIANYDQPLTQHPANNPYPNVSFGIQMATQSHTFQVFFGNYQSILQQSNNFNNQNNYLQSRYCLGFNITKRFFY